jgi:hypothetical protein
MYPLVEIKDIDSESEMETKMLIAALVAMKIHKRLED